MHAPASRRQPSALSRTLSWIGPARAGRGLGDVVSGVVHGVSGVVHDVSGVAHDVGHAVDDALSGQVSKLPGDIVKTGIDVVNTGKDAADALRSALKLSSGHDAGGAASGGGAQSHSSGGGGATQPTPTPNPGAGGGEGDAQTASPSVSPQAPASTTSIASSTSPSTEYTELAPSTSTTPADGAIPVGSKMPSGIMLAQSTYAPAQTGAGWEDGQPGNGMPMSSAGISLQSSTTMGGALPSNGSGAAAAHRKGFPLAAAAAIGAVLGFLVVSALFWAVWLYLRKRSRSAYPAWRHAYASRMLSVPSARSVSTVPLFISASEAGVKDDSNPFRHPRDVEEDDPFDAASLWRSSTTRSASTVSV